MTILLFSKQNPEKKDKETERNFNNLKELGLELLGVGHGVGKSWDCSKSWAESSMELRNIELWLEKGFRKVGVVFGMRIVENWGWGWSWRELGLGLE